MFINNNALRPKKSSSNKKVHRRVITEIEEPRPLPFKYEFKKVEKISSKPKFIDVYSKQVAKESVSQRKNFKIYQNKPFVLEKHLKTQPDELIKPSIAVSHKSKSHSMFSKYEIEGVAGKGTFGVVYLGTNRETGEKIAIKKVLQDKKYKNRELQILKVLNHPNNLAMKDSFLTHQGESEYLNIIMDYYPNNLYQLVKKKEVNSLLVKIYAYQLFRGLNYLNMISIAHRDIKPQNILVDQKHKLVITDFGSAKQLNPTEANLAYICSRCYRAPELIFGATNYTPQIDMWSAGCVIVEMVNGHPPFMGDSQVDQLKEIIKIIGTPTEQQVKDMNNNFDMKEVKRLPQIKKTPWSQILNTKDPLLIDFVTRLLRYSPLHRLTPAQALLHQYFDDLRDQSRYQQMLFKLKSIPELFDFSKDQLQYIFEQTRIKFDLIPEWIIKKPGSLHFVPNKATTSTTNTKRSILSFKAF